MYRIIKYQIGASEIVKPETKAKSPVVALPQTVSNVAVEVCHSWVCTVSYVLPSQMYSKVVTGVDPNYTPYGGAGLGGLQLCDH